MPFSSKKDAIVLEYFFCENGISLNVRDSHSLWQVVHCSPPPPALRGSEHRSRRVPPTANICGGFWLFTSGGARAPRPDGPRSAREEPRQHVLPARPGAVHVGAICALPLPVPARAPLLARVGVLACEAVFPSPAVPRWHAASCVPPCSLPCL